MIEINNTEIIEILGRGEIALIPRGYLESIKTGDHILINGIVRRIKGIEVGGFYSQIGIQISNV